MLGGMSTDELSRTTAPTDDHLDAARTPLLRRPWVVPLALLTVIFVGYAVQRWLAFSPCHLMPSTASGNPSGSTQVEPHDDAREPAGDGAGVRSFGEAGVLEELARADVGHGEVDFLPAIVYGIALNGWRIL
jgi:hypothetical protein